MASSRHALSAMDELTRVVFCRLNPSPITPTTPETVGWNVLAGSVKHTFNSRSGASANETEIIASPAIMTGNTE